MKKLKKHIKKVKQYINDQRFYLKSLEDKTKSVLIAYSKLLTVALVVCFVGVSSHFYHSAYIEKHVGSQAIYVRSPEGAALQGSGTAFEIKAPSGKVYTITNAHVCQLQKDGLLLAQEKQHSNRLIPLRIIEVYQKNDLCLLEGLAGYEGLSLADKVEVGQFAWAAGYPLGGALNISSGRIKEFSPIYIEAEGVAPKDCNKPGMHLIKESFMFMELEICVLERDSVQTDLNIYPGNSGSPLVNIYGNVIGVVFASQSRTNWGSAVPLKDVKAFLSAY